MNLSKKKKLAARVFGVGVDRITFNQERLDEIKEAITNQDIRDLAKDKIIMIKPKKGRRRVEKRKNKRGPGNIKKKIKKRKENYVRLTRKLRGFVKTQKKTGKINKEEYRKVRIQIKNKAFRSKAHMKELLGVK